MRASFLSWSGEVCGVSSAETTFGSCRGAVLHGGSAHLCTAERGSGVLRVLCLFASPLGGDLWHLILLGGSHCVSLKGLLPYGVDDVEADYIRRLRLFPRIGGEAG